MKARMLMLMALCLAACGGSGDSNPEPTSADVTLLFMGNSHTSGNDLTGMVAEMVRATRPGKSVASVEAPGWMFLEERLTDVASNNLLRSQNWSFVILQAQKYSASGVFEYSTAEAEELIRRARQQRAVPIMFPEWPRRATITGVSPSDLTALPRVGVEVAMQGMLRAIAAEAVQVWPPHAWCPSDPFA